MITPKPFRYIWSKCPFEKVLSPKNDVINPLDYNSTCLKCESEMERKELNAFDIAFGLLKGRKLIWVYLNLFILEDYSVKSLCGLRNIKKFLNRLTYPIYYLDFETFQQAIPQWKGVIKKLVNLYDEFSSNLVLIHDNIDDLMIPFQKKYYYNPSMRGSYSIKNVLPFIVPDM